MMGFAKNLFTAVVLLVAGGFSLQAQAKNNNDHESKFITTSQSLGLIKNVFLLVDDKVSGGCWGNAQQVREQVKQSLEQSGLRVYDEPLLITSPLSSNLLITAQGSRGKQGICFGDIRVESYRSVLSNFEGVKVQHQAYNFSRSSMANSRKNLDTEFLDAVEGFMAVFEAEIEASRKDPAVKAILAKSADKDVSPLPMSVLASIFRKSAGTAGDKASPGSR